jgi:hypothetical protein
MSEDGRNKKEASSTRRKGEQKEEMSTTLLFKTEFVVSGIY